MPDKSYVTLEQHRCEVCGVDYDTGSLLLDKRLEKRFDMRTTTDMGLCPDDQKKADEGYIALVEIVESKSTMQEGGRSARAGSVYRTGALAHVRASAWPVVFDMELPRDKTGKPLVMVFVQEGVIKILQEKTSGSTAPEVTDSVTTTKENTDDKE